MTRARRRTNDSRTGTALRAQAKAAAPALPADNDPVPADIDEFRTALARKIMTFLRMPRRCREPICRRTKRCAGRTVRCLRDHPPRPVTPDEMARINAEVLRALRRLGGEGSAS